MKVWNETVANLTLMALGSSAPEIMLSVIEIWAKDFKAGDLGPGEYNHFKLTSTRMAFKRNVFFASHIF